MTPLDTHGYTEREVGKLLDRIVAGPGGCWIYTGAGRGIGYGSVWLRGDDEYSHRFSYTLYKGLIPEGLTIDHLCRVRKCVNPAHLEAVTQRTNTLRSPITKAGLNAAKALCMRGHPLDGRKTGPAGQQWRFCTECRRIRDRAAYRARVEAAMTRSDTP